MMTIRRGRKAGVFLETLLILVSLGLLGKAGLMAATTYKFIHLATPTEGVVSGIGDYGVNIFIQYSAGAKESYAFAQHGFFFGHKQIGQQVHVLYDPADPRKAALDDWSALWFDVLVMGIPGFILLIVGFRMRAISSI